MAKFTTILKERFLKKEEKRGSAVTVFSEGFRHNEMGDKERAELTQILQKYAGDENVVHEDLQALVSITQEVKSITNQAAVLHGERIKRVQVLLKGYQEGAFTAWLKATYGNRQTPYNFLQYYEFYSSMPTTLRPQIEAMPRQAIYTLASRKGEVSKKEEIVKAYQGETKQQMMVKIRSEFPLKESDRRKADGGEAIIKNLHRLIETLPTTQCSEAQIKTISKQLMTLKGLLK